MDKIKCFDQGVPSLFGEIGVATAVTMVIPSPGCPGNTPWTFALLNSTGLWSPTTFQNISGPSLFIVFKLYGNRILAILSLYITDWPINPFCFCRSIFFISYLHLLYLYPVRSVLQKQSVLEQLEQLNSPSKFFNKHFNLCVVPILVNLACLGVWSLWLSL